jgi:3-oxoacyl-[acyl-carrier protein] reductase
MGFDDQRHAIRDCCDHLVFLARAPSSPWPAAQPASLSALQFCYAAAKAGVIMLTRHLVVEVARYGIRVNCLAPPHDLDRRHSPADAGADAAGVGRPGATRRLGTPEDALAAMFLASESAGWITGVTLDVGGGRIVI